MKNSVYLSNLFLGYWNLGTMAISSFFTLFPFFLLKGYFEVPPNFHLNGIEQLLLSCSFVALSMLTYLLFAFLAPLTNASYLPSIYRMAREKNGKMVRRLHTESVITRRDIIEPCLCLLFPYIILNWFILFVFFDKIIFS